jgi:hypothetical protein
VIDLLLPDLVGHDRRPAVLRAYVYLLRYARTKNGRREVRASLRTLAYEQFNPIPARPNERNGLRAACRLMVDKITTVPKSKVGTRVGRLDDEDILRLNRAVLVFLGLALSPKAKREA